MATSIPTSPAQRAAQLAGKRIAERLKRYDFVQKALAAGNPYTAGEVFRCDKPDQVVVVADARAGKQYADAADSPIAMIGDSSAMDNMHLGGHLPARVARHVATPLMFRRPWWGGQVAVELAEAQERTSLLKGRRVVVWTNIGSVFARSHWQKVDLP